jgi:chromate reductase, NAD(P)H dehydrogenase (quinone)
VVIIALVSGSTRSGSTNTAALRTIAELAPPSVHTRLYEGLTDLPAFVPDAEGGPAVDDLRRQLAAADAVLICSPEYAGTLPGSLKNLIDWTVGSGELYRKPVAFINVAAPGRGSGADATLRTVLGYVDADIIEAACVRVTVAREEVGPSGTVTDPVLRSRLASVVSSIVSHLGLDVGPVGQA